MTERGPVKDRLTRLTDDQLRLIAEQADAQAKTADDPFTREVLAGLAIQAVNVMAERLQCKVIGSILAERQDAARAVIALAQGR